MIEHTPGPWTACDNNGYSIWRVTSPKYRAESASRTVAEVVGDSAETEANAHLIAAAPEMYELLERAGEIMIELESLIDNAFTNDASAQRSQWLLDADALLAKIDGGRE